MTTGDTTPAPTVVLSDAFRRFAAAHLRDTATRATYTVVASTRDRSWSLEEVAAATGEEPGDVGPALRRLAAAGVLDIVGRGTLPTRYRWRPAMDYLVDLTTPAPEPVDPVCGMPVSPDSPHRLDTGDGAIRFCSLRCLLLHRSATR